MKTYALIHFKDRKPIKRRYDSVVKAYYDYENEGCTHTELFNRFGQRIISFKKREND